MVMGRLMPQSHVPNKNKTASKPATLRNALIHSPQALQGLQKAIPLILVLSALVVYSNSFSGQFIFDDLSSTRDNPHIRHLFPLSNSLSAPSQSTVAGRPIAALTLAINYAFGGLNVWGYHAFNLILHILNALLLFGVARRSLSIKSATNFDESGRTWLAGAIAFIWVLHPLASETVDYIVQRTELLAAFFLLLTLYCFIRSCSSSDPRRWLASAVAACALGMGCKETMVSAPLIVLLFDRVFLSSSWAQVRRQRCFFHALLMATWMIAAALILTGARSESVGFGFRDIGPWSYFRTQWGVILHYLRLTFWPGGLSIDYSDWPVSKSLGDAVAPMAAILALLGATVWALLRKPAIGFLGASFFLLLAPSSSFVPIITEIVAERRMYLPLAAFISLLLIPAYFLLNTRFSQVNFKLPAFIMLLGIGIVLAFITFRRNEAYGTEISIWTDVVHKRPNNARAYYNLGTAYGREGRFDNAIPLLQRAVEINPEYPEALNNLGAALQAKGRIYESVKLYAKVIALAPQYADAHYNLGFALQRLGLLDEAESQYLEAIRLNPKYAEAHNNLGALLIIRGRKSEGAEHLMQALRIRPDYGDARNNLRLLR
jgi:tetratricopeptide (TPR) repeat protein